MNPFLLFAFMVLAVADGVLTWKIIKEGGRELNPVLAWMITHCGLWQTLSLTRALIVLIVLAAPAALPWLVPIEAAVVVWNVWQLRKGRKNAKQVRDE